jgi:type II secretory pathway pseudopilin PulG
MYTRSSKQGGYSFIELIVYVTVLSFMMVVIVSSLVGISRVYRKVRILELVHSNISTSIETITGEIRTATSADVAASTFDSTSGVLKLNSVDLNGDAKTVTFSISSGQLYISENGSSLGPVTSSNATISEMYFEHIDQSSSDAIKFYITITVGSGEFQKTETFYSTIVMRGSYEI